MLLINTFYVTVTWYSGFNSFCLVDNNYVFIINLSYDKML